MHEPAKLLFGGSPSVSALLSDAVLYARTNYPILILGEPGVGKTAIAELLHKQSGRPGKFVKQGAAWIPDHLEVSELAGHVKGAFTGAYEDRVGLIESAHRGTFFMDELGLASPRVQQLLLQLLDHRVVQRVGEVRERPVDVRFVAATNADLDEMVASGAFRADLRDRFGYLVLRVPRLADRRDEIPTLAQSFIEREARSLQLETLPRLSESVREYLLAAPWRGNIRELEAVCRYAVLHAPPDGLIELCDLPNDFVAGLGDVGRARHEAGQLARARAALARTNGDKTKAANLLGWSRRKLYRVLDAAVSVLILAALPKCAPVTSRVSHRTSPPAAATASSRLYRVA